MRFAFLSSSPPSLRPALEGLVTAPGYGLPEGARVRVVAAADGVRLRTASWRPKGRARGTVCLFHGRIEFIEKYGEVVEDLLGRGFAVATLDFRGQGGSQRIVRNPLKGHVADFDDYRLDAEALMRQVAFADCPPPFFALGHSMAAPILISLARRQPQWFERMVLAAPMIGLPLAQASFLARGAARALGALGFSGAYVPTGTNRLMPLRPFEGNPVTSDARRYARSVALLKQEPQLGVASPTIGWVRAAFRAMAATAMPGAPESLRTPTLVLTAGADRIVDPKASERYAARIRNGGHLMMRGALHELMMERDEIRDLFWAAFDAFVPGSRDLA